MNKMKVMLLIIVLGMLLSIVVLVFLTNKFKKPPPFSSTLITPTSSLIPLPSGILSITPRQDDQTVLSQLTKGYTYKTIILEYHPQSNLLVVFYKNSREEAESDIQTFFSEAKIMTDPNLKIEYIGVQKDVDEPPAGKLQP